ncbi:hypothetical protein L1887_24951 [Cichorium endivia]|nr:hypothetical protein L1887_24951 [Cichorium endivia]
MKTTAFFQNYSYAVFYNENSVKVSKLRPLKNFTCEAYIETQRRDLQSHFSIDKKLRLASNTYRREIETKIDLPDLSEQLNF